MALHHPRRKKFCFIKLNNTCIHPISALFSFLQSLRRRVLLRSLSWLSKESIQFLQSGNARRTGDTISVYQYPTWLPLPPVIFSVLETRVGVAAIVVGQHYKVVCFTVNRDLSPYIECSIYTSQTKLWSKRRPVYAGERNIRLENPVVSGDGHNIFLASDSGQYHRHPPYIVCFDVDEQRSKFLSLPTSMDDEFEFEFVIGQFGKEGLCMIRYCSSSKMFSIWLLMDHTNGDWLKIHEVLKFLNWPGPVECFAFLKSRGLFVMAMQDGSIHAYSLNRQRFTKLSKSRR